MMRASSEAENGQTGQTGQLMKIVISGGPAAGKSTLIERLKDHLQSKPYPVIFIQEAATELMNSGITPWNCPSTADFQRCLFRLQTQREDIFEKTAGLIGPDQVLIICDRGAMDGKAYLDDEEFSGMIQSEGYTEEELIGRYDAVFHLESSAMQNSYSLDNNPTRFETSEEAAKVEQRTWKIWDSHPDHFFIPSSPDPEDKLQSAICAIDNYLQTHHW